MTIRLILILTVFALVLGGVGAAFVQAQPNDPGSAVALDPTQKPKPAKKSAPTKASLKSDARHDDAQSELAAVEVKSSDGDGDGDDNSVDSVNDDNSVNSVNSVNSMASAPSMPSAPSAASAPSTDD